MKKYKVLFKIEPLIKIDKPIKINDTVLYYRGENLIAEIYVRASSISEAEKIANEGVSIVVNSLSQELKSSEIKFVSHTTIDIADDEKIIKHAKNDLLTTFTVRVPFTQDMYSKVKRNADGECGLKCIGFARRDIPSLSLPVWGVWIEISNGERPLYRQNRHSLYGECGLKYNRSHRCKYESASLPVWGVWIEIQNVLNIYDKSNGHSLYGSVN
ncbi:hypothetical protein [Sporosarcina sp. USHLN248]|uniref:hypothetical protein n=1 Tax=Sporosarcina sp. USHLN248 TaxID=3081300 RepID=UPI0038B69193